MAWHKISNFLGGKLYIVDSVPRNNFGEENDKALKLNDYSLYLFSNGGWVKQGHISQNPRQLDFTEENPNKKSYIKNLPPVKENLQELNEIGKSIQRIEDTKKEYYIDLTKTITENQIMITASKDNEEKTHLTFPMISNTQAGFITGAIFDLYKEMENNTFEYYDSRFQGIFKSWESPQIPLTSYIKYRDVFILGLELNGEFEQFFDFIIGYDVVIIENPDNLVGKYWFITTCMPTEESIIYFTVNQETMLFEDNYSIASENEEGLIYNSKNEHEVGIEENQTSKINGLVSMQNKLFTAENSPNLKFSFEDIEHIWDKYGRPVKIIYEGNIEDSYIKLKNGKIIEFNATNTPVSNFCDFMTGHLNINGQNVEYWNIRELVFGNSYNNITLIPNQFCAWGDNVPYTKLDLSGFKNVTNIGDGFFYAGLGAVDLDLSWMGNVNYINSNCFSYNPSIKSINIGDVLWNKLPPIIISDGFFNGIENTSDRILYAKTQQLADDFKLKLQGKISNWTIVIQ